MEVCVERLQFLACTEFICTVGAVRGPDRDVLL